MLDFKLIKPEEFNTTAIRVQLLRHNCCGIQTARPLAGARAGRRPLGARHRLPPTRDGSTTNGGQCVRQTTSKATKTIPLRTIRRTKCLTCTNLNESLLVAHVPHWHLAPFTQHARPTCNPALLRATDCVRAGTLCFS
jgi:hypothetical protein